MYHFLILKPPFCFFNLLQIQMFDKLADFEREMFELQKNHRFNIRELLEEAEKKMTEMKSAHHNEMKVLVRFVVREETNFGF